MVCLAADATPTAGERRFRVLIVDDVPDSADSLAILLGLWGYEVRTAYDGESALTIAPEFGPDCVLLDIRMPRMSGYELAERLRGQPMLQHAKLVALTAFSDETHLSRVRQAGFDHYLTKPADPGELERLFHMLAQALKLAERTQILAQQNVELARETKDLLIEVKEELQEVKEELRDIRQEMRDLKAERSVPP